ncbi:MAG TPA: tRNA (guanosine(37)-N1)-methyltransferase TrmD [Candidatus Pacearchaeota archaeon]|nr:tRNA (guanosine(37)-N1)-methyltransferase TrmD [Candidatus Pacearchaeota archaeon]
MITFEIITIFPEIFKCYFKESLISKAQKKELIKINVYNLRDWTDDKRKTVDDSPYGGGLGMVMKIEPIFKAINEIKFFKKDNPKVVLFTPRGKKFKQKIAYDLSKEKRIIFVCGRYEGIDERVLKHLADIKLSIGDYVLMGGELPAMVVIETISRLIPEVIGKENFLKERITNDKGFIEYPQYTRPEVFSPEKGIYWKVPKILISGNHKEIEKWRKKHGKKI